MVYTTFKSFIVRSTIDEETLYNVIHRL